MTIQLAYHQLTVQLYEIYDTREAANISDWVIEHVTGQRKIDRLVHKELSLTVSQEQTLKTITEQLLEHAPVQYVLHEAWFCNMKLYVDKNVLIPRPETEELVEWVLEDEEQNAEGKKQKRVIDIGTGSGCIPIALKKKMNDVEVYAIDVSGDALTVAQQNAMHQNVEIKFQQLDFLDETEWKQLPHFDIIISNPPYVKKSEEQTMSKNVLQYEPHVALFVPDEDALKFYRAIAEFAKSKLAANGKIYVEINEALAQQVTELFSRSGFTNIILKKDMQGKDRMIKATA